MNKCGECAREWKGMESVMGRLKVLLVARRVRGVAGWWWHSNQPRTRKKSAHWAYGLNLGIFRVNWRARRVKSAQFLFLGCVLNYVWRVPLAGLFC